MLGGTIAARALGNAGKRDLPTEQIGARPQAVRPSAASTPFGGPPPAIATRP